MRLFSALLSIGLMIAGGLWASVAQAAYPERPIQIIIPFAKGGAADLLTRVVTQRMEQILGQPMELVNVTGRGGTDGVFRAAMAPADGYTLVVGNQGTHASSVTLYGSNLRYNPHQDFMPVGMLAATPIYVVVRRGMTDDEGKALRDFKELVAYLRKFPSRIVIGHVGIGSTSHLAALYFMGLTKTQMVELSYKGSAPALKDLSAGVFDIMCDQSASVMQYIREGRVTPLLYAQKQRSPELPSVPSAQDVGLPEFDLEGWNVLFAPKDIPPDVLKTLNQALLKALEDEDVRRQMDLLSALIRPAEENTPEKLRAFVDKEIRRWSSIVRVARLGEQGEEE